MRYWWYALSGPNGQSDVDLVKINSDAAAVEFDANAQVADEEFPSMEEAVMLSRGIRTSVPKSSAGAVATNYAVL